MKVTRQIVADKIADYLHGKVSQAELVDWAERTDDGRRLRRSRYRSFTDIVGRLGLADVAEFGLRWQDCEKFCADWAPRESNCIERMKIGTLVRSQQSTPRSACPPRRANAFGVNFNFSPELPAYPSSFLIETRSPPGPLCRIPVTLLRWTQYALALDD